uniref:Uncharacterized protein n=1 Tax=Anguilla anguilla TaxID=7936 RepID=A0A0E9WPG5_ANGAN
MYSRAYSSNTASELCIIDHSFCRGLNTILTILTICSSQITESRVSSSHVFFTVVYLFYVVVFTWGFMMLHLE